MEKAIKAKVAKAVVPAIDVMFQALRLQISFLHWNLSIDSFLYCNFEVYDLFFNQWVWGKDCATEKDLEDASGTLWSPRSKCSCFIQRSYTWALSLDWERSSKINFVWENAGYNGMMITYWLQILGWKFCIYLIYIYICMYIIYSLIFYYFKKKELEAELANVTGTARPSRKIRWVFLLYKHLFMLQKIVFVLFSFVTLGHLRGSL